MNSKQNPLNTTEFGEESESSNTLSIDEFFKQLEAKEKDLDISAEMVIEYEESEVVEDYSSDSAPIHLSAVPEKSESAVVVFENNSAPPIDYSGVQMEINNLKSQVARMETERGELCELARRRQNDFDSYKNRTERERGETFRSQLSNLATQMLPVVDNLNRAMDLPNNVAEDQPNEFQQFYAGIVLVSQQLIEILAEMGIQPINAVGERFDPHFHEAVATEVTDEFPSQTVTAELLRGYRIGDKVIRASMVKVSVSTITGNLPQLNSVSRNGSSPTE